MKHRTFFWFFLPTALAMLLFIAMPIVSVITQSLHTAHDQVFIEVENCGPFGCEKEVSVDTEATEKIRRGTTAGQMGRPGPFIWTGGTWPPQRLLKHGAHRLTSGSFLSTNQQPAILPGNVLHAHLHVRGHAAADHSRFHDCCGGQRTQSETQGAGDILFASAHDRHPR